MRIAFHLTAGQHEFLTGLQFHLAGSQRFGADFRSLGIQQDRNRDALFLAKTLDAGNALTLLFIAAMGHIQSADVHAGVHKLSYHFVRIAGRTERTDDLRFPQHGNLPP